MLPFAFTIMHDTICNLRHVCPLRTQNYFRAIIQTDKRFAAEPMLPGVRRCTTKNFEKLVIDSDADVFVQDFADWCPCVVPIIV